MHTEGRPRPSSSPERNRSQSERRGKTPLSYLKILSSTYQGSNCVPPAPTAPHHKHAEVITPVPQKGALSGNGVFAERIELHGGPQGGPWFCMTRVLVKGGTFGPRDECTQRGDDGTRLSTANHRSWRRREGPPPPTAGSPQGEHSPTLSPASAGQCVCCQPPRFWLWQPQETQQESSTAPPKHQAVSGGFPHRDTHLCKDTQDDRR